VSLGVRDASRRARRFDLWPLGAVLFRRRRQIRAEGSQLAAHTWTEVTNILYCSCSFVRVLTTDTHKYTYIHTTHALSPKG
jgi:hypothetical protein